MLSLVLGIVDNVETGFVAGQNAELFTFTSSLDASNPYCYPQKATAIISSILGYWLLMALV